MNNLAKNCLGFLAFLSLYFVIKKLKLKLFDVHSVLMEIFNPTYWQIKHLMGNDTGGNMIRKISMDCVIHRLTLNDRNDKGCDDLFI